jgi:hypothetical protein
MCHMTRVCDRSALCVSMRRIHVSCEEEDTCVVSFIHLCNCRGSQGRLTRLVRRHWSRVSGSRVTGSTHTHTHTHTNTQTHTHKHTHIITEGLKVYVSDGVGGGVPLEAVVKLHIASPVLGRIFVRARPGGGDGVADYRALHPHHNHPGREGDFFFEVPKSENGIALRVFKITAQRSCVHHDPHVPCPMSHVTSSHVTFHIITCHMSHHHMSHIASSPASIMTPSQAAADWAAERKPSRTSEVSRVPMGVGSLRILVE